MKAFLILLIGFYAAAPYGVSFADDSFKPKVLYVDSYHKGYGWSDGITAGILDVFQCKLAGDDRVNDSDSSVALRIIRMDTKRNSGEAFKHDAALRAKKVIDKWKPDVVIVSDDNAAKYLLADYYKNRHIPFVFCGVNWDASMYGFPCENVTGMVEIIFFEDLLRQLSRYAKGDRVGLLSQATFTNNKDISQLKKLVSKPLVVKSVATIKEWKSAFIRMQDEADMVILSGGAAGMDNWHPREMQKFTLNHTAVPTGCMDAWMKEYALICFTKDPREQGDWAAKTALRILNGKAPSAIPIVQNQRAKIFLNMNIAKKLGVKFPMSLIEMAHLVEFRKKKILFVNSYHKGYEWSDAIEKGFHKALRKVADGNGETNALPSDVDINTVRMDTRRNQTETYIQRKAKEVKARVEAWQPDILVACDDNAVEYVVVPYYKDTDLPVVFCGINRDASYYGLPAANTTGMIEVPHIEPLIRLLKTYSTGERIGYIGADVISIRKELQQYIDRSVTFTDGGLVSTFFEWQTLYRRLQAETDMVIMLSPVGIPDWDQQKAREFILENIRVPSGTCSPTAIGLSLMGVLKVPEEQGWWAGQAVKAILNGKAPKDIPIVSNNEERLYFNMETANKLGIKFPVDLLEKATLLNGK